jgi:RNA polymerase sigma-70 factor (ECF subfamily)
MGPLYNRESRSPSLIAAINTLNQAPAFMQQLEDPALIDLIIQRDETALGELYDRYHRLVFSIALHVTGRPEDAEEITLDVFTNVWERASTYQLERAKVTTWLTRIARNRAIDVLRREGVRPMKDSISWAQVSPAPADDSDRPESAAQLAIQKERVREAIASLPVDQQEALALAYFKGYSHSEIAHELDIPLGTAKGRIRSGMQKLRALLYDV